MKSILSILILSLGFFSMIFFACVSNKTKDYLNESREKFDARMEWWRDARFGMFIHWGVYSVPAGVYKGEGGHAEWIMETAHIPVEEYEQYATRFNPVKFDADEWASIAKDAGMKYMVITSKHHDGFCLWDSKVSDYDIIDRTPFKRDVLKELSEACEKQGIKFCFYHSIMDWHHPDAKGENFPKYREEYLKPQLTELLTNYGDIGVLWFDGEWIDEWTEEQGKALYNFVRNLQPDIIINNRVGKGRAGMQGMNKYEDAAGDFGTPEQEVLETASNLDWESCMTLNDHWGYNSQDENWKSSEMLIHHLVDIAAKGGNFLLNVGPTSEGLIPQPSVDRLKDMGDWMKVNSDVIYGTHRLPYYREGESIRYVHSHDKNFIYACALQWPGSELKLKYVIPEKNSKIFLLGFEKPLDWRYDSAEGLTIHIPNELADESARPSKYAYCFKIKGALAKVAEKPAMSSQGNEDVETMLFSEDIPVELSSATEGAQIRYTLDGSEPGDNSPLYSQPIPISKTTAVKAIALKQGMVKSEVAEANFILTNKYKSVQLKRQPSPKYQGQGELTIGNWERGSTNYKDGKWLGYEQDDFEAVVDLGKSIPIQKISAGFYQNIDFWIWQPTAVEFAVSGDGTEFQHVATVINEIPQNKDGNIIQDLSCEPGKLNARYVRILAKNIGVCPAWHKGGGGKAWLFVDEIIVE